MTEVTDAAQLINDGPDCYRESRREDGKQGAAYVRQDCDVAFLLTRYQLRATTLGATEATEALNRSSDSAANEGLELPKQNISIGGVNHADISLSAPLQMEVRTSLALITSGGVTEYKRAIELEVHIGPEEHSAVRHYNRSEGLDEAVFFLVYISRQRMEWLHQELISRPNADLTMRGKIRGFKRSRHDYERLFDYGDEIYIEPGTRTPLIDVSFEVRDPHPLDATQNWKSPLNDALESPLNDALSRQRAEWVKEFSDSLEAQDCEPWKRRCANALGYTSQSIAEWCSRNVETPGRMVNRLIHARRLLQDLDEALHDKDGPFVGEKHTLWRHVNFQSFLKSTKPSQREDFVASYRFSESVDEYLGSSFLQNDYLDWLLLDALTAQKTVAVLEAFMALKHGAAYAFVGDANWKMFLWKLIMRPFGFLLGWILPAVGFFFIGQWSLALGIGLFVVYYGISLWMLVRWLWYKASSILTGTPTPVRRLLRQLEELDLIYPLLIGPTMHIGAVRKAFERASEKGVIWDQRIFYILDNLATRSPKVWSNNLPRL